MIVFLRKEGSSFADALAGVAGPELVVRDLAAVQRGEPVRVAGEHVLWQGVELTRAGALVLEELPFAWPQRLGSPDPAAPDDRPRRALAHAALATAAERVPAIDPPEAGHLAALPLLALDALERAGVEVWPYALAPREPGRPALDPAGAVAGYAPRTPEVGEPAWSPEPFEGEVLRVLVVGAEAVGALSFADGALWAQERVDGGLPAGELDPALRERALAAARALGCRAAEITLVRAAGAVLAARPGPAWSRFEAALGPCVPRALWEHALHLESR